MDIPEALKYRVSKPQGFPCNIKETFFSPVSTSGNWVPGDYIRFEIRSNGFMDPYTTRLNFTVEVDAADMDSCGIK